MGEGRRVRGVGQSEMEPQVIAILLLLAQVAESSLGQTPVPPAIGMRGQLPGRPYHRVTLAQMATTRWTHVETCGPVVYRRQMADGDWHLTLSDGVARVVVEIIPALPLPAPKRGDTIRVRGISRRDSGHADWPEVHPAEEITVVARC